jgi:hypothetical protein
MKDVTKNIDISNLQDLIDFDWGNLTEYADILIKLLGG